MNVFRRRLGVTKFRILCGYFRPCPPVSNRLEDQPEALGEPSSELTGFVLSQPQDDARPQIKTSSLPGLDLIKPKIPVPATHSLNDPSKGERLLAGRFKILKRIDADNFSAHDSLLDQTVTLRRTLPLSGRTGNDGWLGEIQTLATAHHPLFLNIIGVFSDQSSSFSSFVITESAQGQSVKELLKDQPRPRADEVLAVITHLADALDVASPFASPNNSATLQWLFAGKGRMDAVDGSGHDLCASQWTKSSIKIDLWQLLKPAKDERPLRRSKTHESVSRRWAVKQTALLLYQLLEGERNKPEMKLKSWFNPVDGLGDAANAILYRGLQGSSRFGSGALFVQRLNLAHSSTKESLKTLSKSAPALLPVSATSPNVQAVTRGFKRQTVWLSLGVLGPMIIATLLLLALGNQPRPGADGAGLGQTTTTFLPKSVPAAQRASSVGYEAPLPSANHDPPHGMETAPSPEAPVASSAPEIEEPGLGVEAHLSPSAPEQNSPQAMHPKAHVMRFKTARRPRTIDVKARLIELWHQSLAQRSGPETKSSDKRKEAKPNRTPR